MENLFYNEQCSFSDSEKIPSQTESKQAECTKCTAHWPSCTPRPRPGRPAGRAPHACRAPRAYLPRARAARLQRVPACRAPLQRAFPASACRPRPAHPLSLRAQCPRAPRPRAPRPRAPSSLSPSSRAHVVCVVPACRAPRLRTVSLCRAPNPAPSLLLKWAVAHFRFCTIFFFHFFQPLENTKNIFIYFLSFSSTPINLLKFISSFYIYIYIFHSPINQTNYLNLFYLFSCSSLHIVNSKVCFPTCLCAIYLSTQTFTSHIQHVIPTKHIHTTIHQST